MNQNEKIELLASSVLELNNKVDDLMRRMYRLENCPGGFDINPILLDK